MTTFQQSDNCYSNDFQSVPFIPFHLEVNFAGKRATVLPEQIRSVSKKRSEGKQKV